MVVDIPFLHKRGACAVLLLAVLVASAPAQAAVPLPDATLLASPLRILRLANDPWEGGVWIGTEGGLIFKDLNTGQLRHYSLAHGLPHFAINDIAPEADRVWIATSWGVAVLDKQTQRIEEVRMADNTPLRLLCRTIFADPAGIWVGTDAGGLFRVDRSTRAATAVPNPENGTTFGHPIYGLGSVGPELYVSATGHGLVRWDRDTGQTWRYDTVQLQKKPFYGRIDVSEPEVWIASEGDGVLHLDRSTWRLSEFASPTTVNSHAVYRPVKAFGSVWFPTREGASVYDGVEHTWRFWHDPAGYSSLNEVVLADGELYGASALTADIVRYDRSLRDWVRADWWTQAQSMDHNLVQSCEREAGSRLVFGTGGGGAHVLDVASAAWSVLGQEPGAKGRPNDINIMDTAADGATRFLTHYNGVSEMDLATGAYRHYFVDGRGPDDKRWGFDIVVDVELGDDTAWFATKTNHEKQLRSSDPVVWHPGKVTRLERSTHVQTLYGAGSGLTDGNLTVLELDGERLWIGTEKWGLDVLDIPTGRITHAYPADGRQMGVNAIVRAPEGLWLATTGQGVILLDPTTLQVQQVTGMGPHIPVSLTLDEDKVWVGTYYGGLYSVSRQSLAATHYGATGPLDRVVYCVALQDGIAYLGTGWGVERLDVASGTFLPQLMLAGVAPTPVVPGEQLPTIGISTPVAGERLEGESITVTGDAQGAAGAQVHVRLGDGPWVQASGGSSWTAAIGLEGASGDVRIAARLERGGTLLAQAFRDVVVGVPASQAAPPGAGPTFTHEPLDEAWRTEPIVLSVTPSTFPAGLAAVVELSAPDGVQSQVPMTLGAGVLTAELPPFEEAGEAAYRIRLSWDGGAARLPQPYSDVGSSYPVLVHGAEAAELPNVIDPGEVRVQAGVDKEVRVVVQNPGARTQHLRVGLAGMDGVTATQSLTIGAGDSALVVLTFRIPANQTASRHDLVIGLFPAVGDSPLTTATVDVVVADASGKLPAAQGAPMPMWIALAALALVAALRRR